jgi:hypothetical protein
MMSLELCGDDVMMWGAINGVTKRVDELENRMRDPSSYVRIMSVEEHGDLVSRIHELETLLMLKDDEVQSLRRRCIGLRRRCIEQQDEIMQTYVMQCGYSEGES